ncbi:MAG: hypothetical protein Q9169_004561 [Polycauliona sp. 2 TL-2023]
MTTAIIPEEIHELYEMRPRPYVFLHGPPRESQPCWCFQPKEVREGNRALVVLAREDGSRPAKPVRAEDFAFLRPFYYYPRVSPRDELCYWILGKKGLGRSHSITNKMAEYDLGDGGGPRRSDGRKLPKAYPAERLRALFMRPVGSPPEVWNIRGLRIPGFEWYYESIGLSSQGVTEGRDGEGDTSESSAKHSRTVYMDTYRLFRLRPGTYKFDHRPPTDVQPYWCTHRQEEVVGESYWVILAREDGSRPPIPVKAQDLTFLTPFRWGPPGGEGIFYYLDHGDERWIVVCDEEDDGWVRPWQPGGGKSLPVAFSVEKFAFSEKVISLPTGSSPRVENIRGIVVPGFESYFGVQSLTQSAVNEDGRPGVSLKVFLHGKPLPPVLISANLQASSSKAGIREGDTVSKKGKGEDGQEVVTSHLLLKAPDFFREIVRFEASLYDIFSVLFKLQVYGEIKDLKAIFAIEETLCMMEMMLAALGYLSIEYQTFFLTLVKSLCKLPTTFFVSIGIMPDTGLSTEIIDSTSSSYWRPRASEDRDGERWLVVLAAADGSRRSSPLLILDYGEITLFLCGPNNRYCRFLLDIKGQEDIVVRYDDIAECWVRQTEGGVGYIAAAYPAKSYPGPTEPLSPTAPGYSAVTNQTSGKGSVSQAGSIPRPISDLEDAIGKFGLRPSSKKNKVSFEADQGSILDQHSGIGIDSNRPTFLPDVQEGHLAHESTLPHRLQRPYGYHDSEEADVKPDARADKDSDCLKNRNAETGQHHSGSINLETAPDVANNHDFASRLLPCGGASTKFSVEQESSHLKIKTTKKRRPGSDSESVATPEKERVSSLEPPSKRLRRHSAAECKPSPKATAKIKQSAGVAPSGQVHAATKDKEAIGKGPRNDESYPGNPIAYSHPSGGVSQQIGTFKGKSRIRMNLRNGTSKLNPPTLDQVRYARLDALVLKIREDELQAGKHPPTNNQTGATAQMQIFKERTSVEGPALPRTTTVRDDNIFSSIWPACAEQNPPQKHKSNTEHKPTPSAAQTPAKVEIKEDRAMESGESENEQELNPDGLTDNPSTLPTSHESEPTLTASQLDGRGKLLNGVRRARSDMDNYRVHYLHTQIPDHKRPQSDLQVYTCHELDGQRDNTTYNAVLANEDGSRPSMPITAHNMATLRVYRHAPVNAGWVNQAPWPYYPTLKYRDGRIKHVQWDTALNAWTLVPTSGKPFAFPVAGFSVFSSVMAMPIGTPPEAFIIGGFDPESAERNLRCNAARENVAGEGHALPGLRTEHTPFSMIATKARHPLSGLSKLVANLTMGKPIAALGGDGAKKILDNVEEGKEGKEKGEKNGEEDVDDETIAEYRRALEPLNASKDAEVAAVEAK